MTRLPLSSSLLLLYTAYWTAQPQQPQALVSLFFLKSFLSLLICLFLHMCVDTDMPPTQRSEDNLRQSVLSLYHVGPND